MSVLKELALTLIDGQSAFQEAREVVAQLEEIAGQDGETSALQAECLWGLSQNEEAARTADQALQKDAHSERALLLRAKLYAAESQPGKAMVFLERLLQDNPHHLRARQELMLVCQQNEDGERVEKERKLLDESKRLWDDLTVLHSEAAKRPWDDVTRQKIAALCSQLNRLAEARMWLESALASNPDNDQAKQLLERLGGSSSPPTSFSPPK